jgi:hypothetical protein
MTCARKSGLLRWIGLGPTHTKVVVSFLTMSRRTYLQEKSILQTSKVFEMVIPLQIIMQVSHTHREVLVCELIHHLGPNPFAGFLARAPF